MPENDLLRPLEVLLVEDNPLQVKLVQAVIRKKPIFSISHIAGDGQDALDYLKKCVASDEALPDVILCDLHMPNMDGFELLGIVKADDRFRAVPFVVFTTSQDARDVDTAYLEGAATFISKPIDLRSLQSTLEQFACYWRAAKWAPSMFAGEHADADSAETCSPLELSAKSLDVMIVEDSPTQRALIQKVLDNFDEFHVSNTAVDGQQAMDYLKRIPPYEKHTRPNLVLLDLNLPKKDGFQVLHEIKMDPDLQSTIVVVLTESDRTDDVLKCYYGGANTFLSKPITDDGINSVLERFSRYWAQKATRLPQSRTPTVTAPHQRKSAENQLRTK